MVVAESWGVEGSIGGQKIYFIGFIMGLKVVGDSAQNESNCSNSRVEVITGDESSCEGNVIMKNEYTCRVGYYKERGGESNCGAEVISAMSYLCFWRKLGVVKILSANIVCHGRAQEVFPWVAK